MGRDNKEICGGSKYLMIKLGIEQIILGGTIK